MKGKIIGKKKCIFLLAIITLVLGTIVFFCIKNIKQNEIACINPELAVARTYEQFVDGDENIDGTDNVKFSAFFLRDLDGDSYAEKIKGTCLEVGKQDTLFMELIVQTGGYLKNGKIQIDGKNFYLQTALPKDNELKANYIGINTTEIEFQNLQNGTQKFLIGTVKSGDYTYNSTKTAAIGNNINNYSRNDNKIILTGTYVDENENEIEITKEIDLSVDWYGMVTASISSSNQNNREDLPSRIDEENNVINLCFNTYTNENTGELNIYSNYLSGIIPELNGYAPIEVKHNGSLFAYNEETRKFIINNLATTDENGKIVKGVSRNNNYLVQVSYPLEAFREMDTDFISIDIPVETYFQGFNNPNDEFQNPIKSNNAKTTIKATFSNPRPSVIHTYSSSVKINVGEYMSYPTQRYVVKKKKPLRIYNGLSTEELEDRYEVRWEVYTGTNGNKSGSLISENGINEEQKVDQFIKNDSTTISMDNLLTNIGIGFLNLESYLKEDGWLKVYDVETGELLLELDKPSFTKYTSSKPFYFDRPVRHIRVETSETNADKKMYVYSIKELDDSYITENFTRSEFDALKYIKSNVCYKLGDDNNIYATNQAEYEEPYSLAKIDLSKKILSTQIMEENNIITISAEANEKYNQTGWTNGVFLVKLPNHIIDASINSVQIDNYNVSITSYEIVDETENKFIKINTSNSNPERYTITINTNWGPDPRMSSTTEKLELYAINEESLNYFYKINDQYDVNSNGNIIEDVNYSCVDVELIAPNSLLTNQTISDYDGEGTEILSPKILDLKPIYGDDEREKQSVRIGAQLKNNYANTISEITILGKIPFEGNTYVLSNKPLNSEFSVIMKDSGIIVPEELNGKVTVYYSDNEKPTKEINNEANNWKLKEEITNWENIKTYLISFGDETVGVGKEYTFYYDVEIPFGVEFNKIAYSHHGIYFCLETAEGKYRTRTEPNKIGVRIAEKYNLELNKYQKGKNNLVEGATYKVSKLDGEGNILTSKTATTDELGKVRMDNLYAEMVYEIQEIKVTSDYELNDDIIKFIGHVDVQTGVLTIEKLEGETRNDLIAIKNEGEDYKVIVNTEDEVKAKIKIIKVDSETQTAIDKVKYRILGANLPSTGKVVTTDVNGEIILNGLKLGEIYSIEETKADGYYLDNRFKFKIVNNAGSYEIEIIENEDQIKSYSVVVEDEFPIALFELQDEKIPTYNLEITKIKHETEVVASSEEIINNNLDNIDYIEGAKFKLFKDGKELGVYVTDQNGKIIINDLYQYEDLRNINQTYELKEIYAPEGYVITKDMKFSAQQRDGNLKFDETIQEGGKPKNYLVDGNTIKVIVEDSPVFKLTKRDGETGELLPNTKFAIYNVENGVEIAKNSKGEIIGEKEIINDQEYYVVRTDNNGEITLDLPEGLYKAVEVEASDIKYESNNKEWYFGIGSSSEGYNSYVYDSSIIVDGMIINSTIETDNGDYVCVGYSTNEIIDFGNGISLTNNAQNSKGIIAKYNKNKVCQWAKFVGDDIGETSLKCVQEVDEEIYIAGEISSSFEIDGYNIDYYGGKDIIVLKIDLLGNIEWAKTIGGASNEDVPYMMKGPNGEIWIGTNIVSNTLHIGETQESGLAPISHGGGGSVFLFELSTDGIAGKIEVKKSYHTTRTYTYKTKFGAIDSNGRFLIDVHETDSPYNYSGAVGYRRKIYSIDENRTISSIKDISTSDSTTSMVGTEDGGVLMISQLTNNDNYGNVSGLVSGAYDIAINKYDQNLNGVWNYRIGGMKNEAGYGITFTNAGEFLISGSSTSSEIFYNNTSIIEKRDKSSGIAIKIKKGDINKITNVSLQDYGGDLRESINAVCPTEDGGYVFGGYFASEQIEINNRFVLNGKRNSNNGFIVKKSKNGSVEWVKNYSCSSGANSVSLIKKAQDGGIFVLVYCGNKKITIEDEEINVDYNVIVKYDKDGELEWYKEINGFMNIEDFIETKDGEYVIAGKYTSVIGMIVKYDKDFRIIFEKEMRVIRSSSINNAYFSNIIELESGDYIAIGKINAHTVAIDNYEINWNSRSNQYLDMILVKISKNGTCEWVKTYTGDHTINFNSICSMNDNHFMIGGDFSSKQVNLGNGKYLYKDYTTNYCWGMIVEFDDQGNAIYSRIMRGSKNVSVNSLFRDKNENLLVSGKFESNVSAFGNRVDLSTNGGADGFLIMYDKNHHVRWAESIGGSSSDLINQAIITEYGKTVGVGESSGDITIENNSITNNGSTDGIVFEIKESYNVKEVESLNIENNRKKYKITTEVKKIDGVTGGTISGENDTAYEVIKYGDNSIKEIKMTPNQDYEIIGITVNGEDWDFAPNMDGTYTMPQFENIVEDKHIVVQFALKNNKITINKVDSVSGEKLANARFKLDQIEERTLPSNYETIDNLVDNSNNYYEYDVENEVTSEVMGELIANGDYYFVQNELNQLVPTNSQTWQVANVADATSGVPDTYARSYIPIDLTEKEGKYKVLVSAEASSQLNADYGFINIRTNTNPPSYADDYPIIYKLSGEQSATNVESINLDGGRIYYLHISYYKNSDDVDSGLDQFLINSIKVYGTKIAKYNFVKEEVDGKFRYVSTNQGKPETTSNSYVEVDLEEYTGKYDLTINVDYHGQNGDYGYVTINNMPSPPPTYVMSANRLIYVGSSISNRDYTTVLSGGSKYYIHLGYYKNSYDINYNVDIENDRFVINSIKLSLNNSDLYHTTIETNFEGQAISQIPFGKYELSEIQAPDGYYLSDDSQVIEFRSFDGAQHEFDFENEKISRVIIHHYIKGTETKVDEDEVLEGRNGETYISYPSINVGKYELEEIDGNKVLPPNQKGQFTYENQEVIYYYVPKKSPVRVNHYIEGTTNYVPLKNGGLAENYTLFGYENDEYSTSEIPNEELSDDYELAEIPSNKEGLFGNDEIVVNYYYKEVVRNITINKTNNDGTIILPNAKFNIRTDNGNMDAYTISGLIRNGSYYFVEDIYGKLKNNNQNRNSSVADSYYKIDMRNATMGITAIINAEIGSEANCDYGYVTLSKSPSMPTYSNTDGQVFRISGMVNAKFYTVLIPPGEEYYLHICYRKDGSVSTNGDTFTINSIIFEGGNESKNFITDENGKISVDLKHGNYILKEIESPAGYELSEDEYAININRNTEEKVTLNITNDLKKGKVIVHHYLEGTTTPIKLANGSDCPDEVKENYIGEIYATKVKEDAHPMYKHVRTTGEESGEYQDGTIEVNYYYDYIDSVVNVHYYEEGTNKKISEDRQITGKITAEYHTVEADDIPEYYELVEQPSKKDGIITYEPTEVIYEYRLKEYPYTINYYKEKTTEKLENSVNKNAAYGTVIKAIDKEKDILGYKVVDYSIDEISISTGENVINIYYGIDENQKKEIKYTINYYKDNSIVIEDTQNESGFVQILEDDITEVDMNKIDLAKYPGYELDTEKTIIPDTIENNGIINIYYKLKKAELIIHYVDKYSETSATIIPDKNIETHYNEKFDLDDFKEDINGFVIDLDYQNEEFTIDNDVIEKTIYYIPKSKIIVHHIDKKTGEEMDSNEIDGLVREKYTVYPKDFSGYVIVERPDEENIEMIREPIDVYYYYAKASGGVVEKHIDVKSGNMLYEEYHKGVEHDPYDIKSKTFEKYDLVEEMLPEKPSGTMTEELIEVRYYYIKKVDVIVECIDINTEELILDRVVISKHEGDNYSTKQKDIDGYVFVEVEGETTGEIGANDIRIVYKYAKIAEVHTHYIDKSNGTILDEKNVSGYVGKEYETEQKEFEGYVYFEDSGNTKGKMAEEIIDVYYYYVRPAKVVIHHIDKKNDIEIEQEIISGYVGKEYETKEKDYPDLKLLENSENTNGKMTNETINVYYYYVKITQVIVKYIDRITNKEIDPEEGIQGYVGEEYKTKEKLYEEYVLVEDTKNTEGEMGEETIEVVYYYSPKAEVKVKYIDNDTGEEIETEENIDGYIGKKYDTEKKKIKEYQFVKSTNNTHGTMEEKKTEVVYYYSKSKVEDNTQNTTITNEYDTVTNNYYNTTNNYYNTTNNYYSVINNNYADDKQTTTTTVIDGRIEQPRQEVIQTEQKVYANTNANKEQPINTTKDTPKQYIATEKEKKKEKVDVPNTGDTDIKIILSLIGLTIIANIIVCKKRKENH